MQTTPENWKIYLDNCCLSSLFDDQTQNRIRVEAEAILQILAYFDTGQWQWITSEIVTLEINQNPNFRQRFQVRSLLNFAHHTVSPGETEISRGEYLELLGIKHFDALHLACAETGNVDVFLTTDDRLLRTAKNLAYQMNVQVENPSTWLKEVMSRGSTNND